MEHTTNKEKKINQLPVRHVEEMKYIAESLVQFIEKKEITEDSVLELESLVTSLYHMKNEHSRLLIRWLKQGYYTED
jgi:hypothetical protein